MVTSTPSDYIFALASEFSIPLHVNNERTGIAADWNFGLQTTKARFVTLAHQDDIYYPSFHAETVALLNRHPSAALCFTGYEELICGRPKNDGRAMRVKKLLGKFSIGGYSVIPPGWRQKCLLAFGSVIPCPSVTFNRSVIGGFRFENNLTINLDWQAWWHLHLSGHTFLNVNQCLMAHRIDDLTETSKGKSDGRRELEDMIMFSQIWPKPLAHVLAALYKLGY
jgi:hypothetical protein